MTRKLRALGVALVATLAMSAVGASAAQAATQFVAGSGSGTAKFTLEQDSSSPLQVFQTDLGELSCKTVHTEGTNSATATSIELTGVEYKKCKWENTGLAATVHFNSCHYVASAAGPLYLSPDNCEVTISGPDCAVKMSGGQLLENVAYTNIQETGQKKELAANVSAEGIRYSWTENCYSGAPSSGSDVNGTYNGELKMKAADTSDNPLDLELASGPAGFHAGEGVGAAKIALEQDPSNPLQTLTTEPSFPTECQKFRAESPVTEEFLEEFVLEGVQYSKCPDSLGLQHTVNFGSCVYTIHNNGAVELGGAGCSVNITSLLCSASVPGGQAFGAGSVSYMNIQEPGSPREILAHMDFSGIDYSLSGSHCGGTNTNGTYDGIVRLKAFTPEGTQEDLTFE